MDTWDCSEALEAVGGDEALLWSLVDTLLQETPALVADLYRALAEGNAMKLRLAAHTLKGSFRCFGPLPALDLASQLESLAREGRLAEAPALLQALEFEVRDTMRVMAAARQLYRPGGLSPPPDDSVGPSNADPGMEPLL